MAERNTLDESCRSTFQWVDFGIRGERLLDGSVTITPKDILDECNHDIIPLCIVVGYEESDVEIGEVFDDYELVLI